MAVDGSGYQAEIDALMHPAKVRRLRREYDYLVGERARVTERLRDVIDELTELGEQP